ncbi:unnamed protein product, partial [Allacma fusca]
VEPDFPGAFITEHPYVSLQNKSGIQNNVPVLIGVTENEDIFKRVTYISAHPRVLRKMNLKWKKLFPILFEYNSYYVNFSSSVVNYISKQVRNFYFNGKDIDENNQDVLRRALADRIINYGMRKTVSLLARSVPVFPFLIDSSQSDSFETHRKGEPSYHGGVILTSLLKIRTFLFLIDSLLTHIF